MVKGCLFSFIAGLVILFIVIGTIWFNREDIAEGIGESFKGAIKALDVPEYGKKEYIEEKHGLILQIIKDHANESESVFQFAAAIEELPFPKEFVYIAAHQADNTTDIIKKIEWDGQSTKIINNCGVGTLHTEKGPVTVMIYEHIGPYSYMDSFKVYIEYKEEVPENLPTQPEAQATEPEIPSNSLNQSSHSN